MSRRPVDVAPVTVEPLSGVRAPAWAGRIAGLTRAAYARSDPFPGLPVPDGARETESDVRADLSRGARIWCATTPDGELAGTLRVTAHEDGWEIRRVSVAPDRHGRGIARCLLETVEDAALTQGVPRLWLDAVVERCLPPAYTRLGFRAVRHWGAEDKPLSETTMERVPGSPRDVDLLPLADRAETSSDVLVTWLTGPSGLLGVIDAGLGPRAAMAAARRTAETYGHPGALPVGVDVWAGAGADGRDRVEDRFRDLAPAPAPGVHRFPGTREQVTAHLMPRTVHPRLHAVLRLAPGRQPHTRRAGARPAA
uniref:GCN5-related N-acetyltransferase n=1 Tax=Streptomyces sp. SANK 60404 TaxID=1213862 RepID=A0A1B4ZDD5_9ACTN|nr:GCN5-related N-acetyltransferase [Streptomyces sp. SANK 60404]